MGRLKRKAVYLDEERDADLLAYLARQDSESAAIRRALRNELAGRQAAPPIDRDTLRQILREELAGLALSPVSAAAEDEEIEGLLDDLSNTLLME